MLSDVFFIAQDDMYGTKLSKDMKNGRIEFCNFKGKGRNQKYRKVIKATVQLYFYRGEDYVFSYTRANGQTAHWRSL